MKVLLTSLHDSLYLIVVGIIDSFSLYKVIPILLKKKHVASILLQIALMNVLLVLGSIAFYEIAIKWLSLSNDYYKDDSLSVVQIDYVKTTVFTIYHLFWLFPILSLCYACTYSLNQKLSKELQAKGSKDKANSNNNAQETIYLTVFWLIFYIQTQLLFKVIPSLITLMCSILVKFDEYLLFNVARVSLMIVGQTSYIVGYSYSAFLYGWYSFDLRYSNENLTVEERIHVMGHHFEYLLGFGVSYVILFLSFNIFFAYGIYLIVFPFSLILGTVSDYKSSSRSINIQEDKTVSVYKKSILSPAKYVTDQIFKILNKVALVNMKKNEARKKTE